jgi:hypothetical protein
MHYLSSLYWVTTPLQVSDPFVAHHQEVVSVCVANGTWFSCQSSVGGPGWKLTFNPGQPSDHLEEKQTPLPNIHLLPPDDGLQMGPKPVKAW